MKVNAYIRILMILVDWSAARYHILIFYLFPLDVDRIGGDSDMSLEEDEDTLTKKKSRGKSYDSGGDSPKKKKKGLKKNAGSGSDFSD